MKGKIPNASRTSVAKFLTNKEIQDIITCIGTKTGDLCEPNKCRVGSVLLLPDSDPDGQHIATLCLAFFALYMPQLVEAGMLFIVDAPLFVADFKSKSRNCPFQGCAARGRAVTTFVGGEIKYRDRALAAV